MAKGYSKEDVLKMHMEMDPPNALKWIKSHTKVVTPQLFWKMYGGQSLIFDTETLGLNPFHKDFMFKTRDGKLKPTDKCLPFLTGFAYFDIDKKELIATQCHWESKEEIKIAKKLLNKAETFINHNLKYDLQVCFQVGMISRKKILKVGIEDTLIMANMMYDRYPSKALEFIAPLLLGWYQFNSLEQAKIKALYTATKRATTSEYGKEWSHRYVNYSFMPRKDVEIYNIEDLQLVYGLHTVLRKRVFDECFVAYDIDATAAKMAVIIEDTGIKVDVAHLGKLIDHYTRRQKLNETVLEKLTGIDLNYNSPKQMKEFLTDLLGEPIEATNKKTLEKTLISLREKKKKNAKRIKFIEKLFLHRSLSKVLNTYLIGIRDRLDKNDLLHCIYTVGSTATGRFSATDPNLHNIPRIGTTVPEKSIRSTFIARKDYFQIYMDFSQIELRRFAHHARDERLIQAFKDGADIHQLIADWVDTTRQRAKTLTFGDIYGMGVRTLAMELDIGWQAARDLKESFADVLPGKEDLKKRLNMELRENGFIKDMFGRMYHVPWILRYLLINALIQGECACILKESMKRLFRIKDHLAPKWLTVNNIHDEVVDDVPMFYYDRPDTLRNVLKAIEKVATNFDSRVPLTVNFSYTLTNWAEKKPIEELIG